ncbi:hypothetical protein MJO28_008966 [Puccinia striiformis f. sp. tritici]|uniref:Uncharacterized protein n=1 Tax=Puccinia striiformis f. sp. tritici TaxID=168172 RepID=A0ACC0EC45_9BASI|nr:hypothetical protein MJO28_008966 [Puccinia striiformis f. sp. tritici]
MADSTESSEGELMANGEREGQEDPVIEGFKNLFEKCRAEQMYQSAQQNRSTGPGLGGRLVPSEDPLVEQTDPDNDLLVGLSSTLSQLKQQIDAIVELFEPANLLKDQQSKYKLILGIQSDLNRTMDQIFSATRILGSAQAKIPSRINDQHLQALKRYRFNRLHFRLTYSGPAVLFNVIQLCQECGNIIRVLQITTKEDHHWARIAKYRKRILGDRWRVLPTIESSIICASGTEFDIIQDQWRDCVRSMDGELQILICMLDPREATYYQPLTESETQLGKSLVPVLKLSRVFFKKFSKQTMGGRQFPLFTTMSSDQLDTLGGLADNIEGGLGGMIEDDLRDLSNKAEEGGDSEYINSLMKQAQKLEKYFGAGLLLILIHFLPVIPDAHGYKDWLFVWNSQLTLAINNFIQACRGFEIRNPDQ